MSVLSAQVFNRFAAREGMVGEEQAIISRPTSSANFYISSTDRSPGFSSGNFIINKSQNLFTGFFNRIAVNEIVVNWGIPNVAGYWGNNTFEVTLSGAIVGTFSITLQDGFYTVEQLLDEIASLLNNATTPGLFVVNNIGYTYTLSIDQGVSASSMLISTGSLASQLFTPATILQIVPYNDAPVICPVILPTKYIDIVSDNLTYNQKVRDSTTSTVTRDVLYRWYFAYDNVPILRDAYQFPILEGYDPFVHRRTPPVVKQIRWSEIQPVGQVSFQVYDDQGRQISDSITNFPSGARFEFQMSCLLSEE